ncbi:MAG: hypothetical protein B5M54_09835 [Candidatus Aminicenantes bacterium 4484_214]|nr:MAG: hypothetical protein B5M54_09835 [Candidatus Aminicenantes bacterium 4484_214]
MKFFSSFKLNKIFALIIILFYLASYFSACSSPTKDSSSQSVPPQPQAISYGQPPEFMEVFSPPGNDYADPSLYAKEKEISWADLPPAILSQVQPIISAPQKIIFRKQIQEEKEHWSFELFLNEDDYLGFEYQPEGKLIQIFSYVNEKTEEPGAIFYQGNLQPISLPALPSGVKQKISQLSIFGHPQAAWQAKGRYGQRYLVSFISPQEETVFSLGEKGFVFSAGPRQAMLQPALPYKQDSLAEIEKNLAPFKDKYNLNQILNEIKSQAEKVSIKSSPAFRFAVMGDSRSNLKVFQYILQSINRWQPDFVINTGDLTYNGYAEEMNNYLFSTLDKFAPFPFIPVIGNHDCRRGSQAYHSVFGPNSHYFYFDFLNARFIILDNNSCPATPSWSEQLSAAEEWLRTAGDMKKFVFIHRPPAEIEKWAYHSMPYRMSRPFTKLMSQYKVDHVFCGHIHAYSTATYQGIPYTITGGGGGPLHQYFGEKGSSFHYVMVDVYPQKIEMILVRLVPLKKEK